MFSVIIWYERIWRWFGCIQWSGIETCLSRNRPDSFCHWTLWKLHVNNSGRWLICLWIFGVNRVDKAIWSLPGRNCKHSYTPLWWNTLGIFSSFDNTYFFIFFRLMWINVWRPVYFKKCKLGVQRWLSWLRLQLLV